MHDLIRGRQQGEVDVCVKFVMLLSNRFVPWSTSTTNIKSLLLLQLMLKAEMFKNVAFYIYSIMLLPNVHVLVKHNAIMHSR